MKIYTPIMKSAAETDGATSSEGFLLIVNIVIIIAPCNDSMKLAHQSLMVRSDIPVQRKVVK